MVNYGSGTIDLALLLLQSRSTFFAAAMSSCSHIGLTICGNTSTHQRGCKPAHLRTLQLLHQHHSSYINTPVSCMDYARCCCAAARRAAACRCFSCKPLSTFLAAAMLRSSCSHSGFTRRVSAALWPWLQLLTCLLSTS